MTRLALFGFLFVAFVAACGDDTSTTSGNGGAGGDDPVVTVAGSGGHPGCEPGDSIPCTCPNGNAGTKQCVNTGLGETEFTDCGPC